MRVSVVGCGYVGLVTGACLAHAGHEVVCTDAQRERMVMLRAGRVPFFEPGLEALVQAGLASGRLRFVDGISQAVGDAAVAIIAVGTPASSTGAPDLRDVETVARDLGRFAPEGLVVVVKSTVPVGTHARVAQWLLAGARESSPVAAGLTRETLSHVPDGSKARQGFAVVSCPEFLREGRALEDTFRADRIVVGTDSLVARGVMAELFAPFTNGTIAYEGNTLAVPIVWLDPASAELAKYAANAFLATKVSFINEFALLCERVGADVTAVARVMGMDRRIGAHFLDAGIGWGGSCFPKDLSAVLTMAGDAGLEPGIVAAAVAVNERQHQWVKQQLAQHLPVLAGQRVGLLGLAFKPDTDDLRCAPAIAIARALSDAGVRVCAYDPVVQPGRWDQTVPLEFRDSPYALAEGCSALVLVTEWDAFRQLDWGRMRLMMEAPFLLLDARNALPEAPIRDSGLLYRGLGRTGKRWCD